MVACSATWFEELAIKVKVSLSQAITEMREVRSPFYMYLDEVFE